MALVLANATVVSVDTGNRIMSTCDIRIAGIDILAVGPALAEPGEEVRDCSNTVIIPGLVNVHTHAATGLFRGLADDRPKSFWSPNFSVPGQDRFQLDDYQASLRAVCAESLLNCITCIRNHRKDSGPTALGHSG
jgi:5-methylthioadenosine/S-adenosylhomocysteine deaminase